VVGGNLGSQNPELGKEGEKVEGGGFVVGFSFFFFFFFGDTRVLKRLGLIYMIFFHNIKANRTFASIVLI
jgi:hypothetical protein